MNLNQNFSDKISQTCPTYESKASTTHGSPSLLVELLNPHHRALWHQIYEYCNRTDPKPTDKYEETQLPKLLTDQICVQNNKRKPTTLFLSTAEVYRYETTSARKQADIQQGFYTHLSNPLDGDDKLTMIYSAVGVHALGWFNNKQLAAIEKSYAFTSLTQQPFTPNLLTKPFVIIGTEFQHKVWRSLQQIALGSHTCYSNLSTQLGLKQGWQATGSAVGHNPLSLLIPCHRVLGKTNELRGYRWGLSRKLALLIWESKII